VLCARDLAQRNPDTGRYQLGLHLAELGQMASDVLPVNASRIDDAVAAVAKGSLRILPVLRRLVASLGRRRRRSVLGGHPGHGPRGGGPAGDVEPA